MRSPLTASLERIDRLQQQHRPLGVTYATFKRFGEHDGGRLAATISYYAFFSVFPLLLVFVTVLGIVLRDDDALRQDLVDGALGQIPVIGSQLADSGGLPGSGVVLAFGAATALWAGLGAVAALREGLDVIGDVPIRLRGNFLVKKLREIAFLALLAVGVSLSTLAANVATLFDLGWAAGGAGLVLTAIVDAGLLLMMFVVLPARHRPVRELLPGVLVGAVALVALQQLGSFVVRRYIAGASDTYGTFAIVIALLSWFFLVSRVILMAAQANSVLGDRLSPRRLRGDGPPTDADRRATLLDVERIQRDPHLGDARSVGGTVATNDEPVPGDRAAADQVATSR